MTNTLNSLIERLEKVSGKKVKLQEFNFNQADALHKLYDPNYKGQFDTKQLKEEVASDPEVDFVKKCLDFIFLGTQDPNLSLVNKHPDAEKMLENALNKAKEDEEEYIEGIEYYDHYVFKYNENQIDFDIWYKVDYSINYSYDPGFGRTTPPSYSYREKLESKEINGIYTSEDDFTGNQEIMSYANKLAKNK